jgi:cellulose synthase operon protein B
VERPLQLRDLSSLFSPAIGGLGSILLLNSPDADLSTPDTSYLNKALPLIAQSLALRRDYAPLTIRHDRWQTDPAHTTSGPSAHPAPYLPHPQLPEAHVLVGTRDELAAILPESMLNRINGPFLDLTRIALADNDAEGMPDWGFRLIVSGTSGEEVTHAARVLAQIDEGISTPQQWNVLAKDRYAQRTAHSQGYFLEPDTRYSFADLGQDTATMQGAGVKRVSLNLPIRGNFYTHESASVVLQLDFSYGAGMGTGSVMSVFLNGEYVHGLVLKQPNGGAFRGYRISVPARKLQPGINSLDFEFSLRAETVAGECRSIPASHLIVQMLDSSTISLPKASPVAIQPDLAAFSATAFPYIATTHEERTELAVASEEMLGNALSLAGKLAQLSRLPAEQLRVRTTIPAKPSGNTLLLATPPEMPASLFDSVAESMERGQHWAYQMLNQLRPVRIAQSRDTSRLMASRLIHGGGLDGLGMMMAMHNPHSITPATVTVIAADSHEMLTQRVTDLLTPQVWAQLRGDLVVWEGPRDAVVTMQVNEYFEMGEQDHWNTLALIFSNNPWYMLAALLLTILLIGLLSRGYLRRREAQKLAE